MLDVILPAMRPQRGTVVTAAALVGGVLALAASANQPGLSPEAVGLLAVGALAVLVGMFRGFGALIARHARTR